MGASWVEVETLIAEIEALGAYEHAEALPAVTRARDAVAEAATAVSMAAVTNDRRAEGCAQDLLARARVALLDARTAVARARDAVSLSRATREAALMRIAEARQRRARDTAARRPVATTAPDIEAPLGPPRGEGGGPTARA